MVETVASRLEAVTVYAAGARVTRVARIAAPVPARVRIAGLPLAVIDDTVRVEIVGAAVATSLHADVDAPAPADDVAAEEPADVRMARRRSALAEAELERVDAALSQLDDAPLVEPDPSDDAPATWDAVLAARTALVGVRAARELALREQRIAAEREVEDARRALEVLLAREARASTARVAKLHELRKLVDIELVAGDGDIELRLEYQVAAARWAPSYVARLDDRGARFELRAVVAQSSGEDWLAATLVLSTAEPAQLSDLPELAPQRIGRRQDPPARRGFRAPPAGADALYADFDRSRTRAVAKPKPEPVPPPPLDEEVWDDGSSHGKAAFETPPGGVPMPQMFAQAVPVMSRAAAPKGGGLLGRALGGMADRLAAPSPAKSAPMPNAKRRESVAYGAAPETGGGGGEAYKSKKEAKHDDDEGGAPEPRLDYTNLRMAAPGAADRGRLRPAPRGPLTSAVSTQIEQAAGVVARLSLPPGCASAWSHTYDYAFEADGRLDVPSDGAWHSLAITAKPATVALRHVSVPREQADVFRVASITNPFDGPLLPGPIDVYDRGQFLVTSSVEATPPAGKVEIGLGVDATVKVARNIEFREEATGMLRGGLRLIHGITIDAENLSARPVELEIRERVPVTAAGDDAIEVTLTRVEPAWERWTPDASAPVDERLRGAHRWRVALAPKAKATLRAGYEIKIASKLELVGGNRREQ